jgi:Peptidase family M20/M25/M40
MERGMSVVDDVVALIDRDELVRFTLEICNIDSAVGHEGEVGEHLYKWMLQEGFAVRKLGLLSDRFNLLGTLSGTGGGYSLIFNSHMDTAVPRQTDLVHADPTHRVYHSAWKEDDLLIGEGVCNDKGPMAAFLIAANAIRSSGHRLKGDLLLSAVVAETGGEPCDEPPGTLVESKGNRCPIFDHAWRGGGLRVGRRRNRFWVGMGRGRRVLVQTHASFRSTAILYALFAGASSSLRKSEHDRLY